MKTIGIVRKLDHLGRITLPKELRNYLHMTERQELEIYVEENRIILEKACTDTDYCYCCQQNPSVVHLYDRGLCQDCMGKILDAREKITKGMVNSEKGTSF